MVNVIKVTGADEWSPVIRAAFSPDGHRIVSGSFDATVRLWDAETGQPVGQALTGHTNVVTSVAFSPDGRRIVSGSYDNTVRVWDAATGQPVGQPFTGHTAGVNGVAFSPDGKRIASASADKTVRVWDADTGKPVGQPFTGHTNYVNDVAFSPDGKRIVSGSEDGTLRLWNADTGQPIGQPMTGHRPGAALPVDVPGARNAGPANPDAVASVAFSPDGKTIVSGAGDNNLRVWPTYPDPVSAMCSKLAANMSHKQWRDWVSPDIDYIKGCPGLPVAPD